jgi:hypothetical protein
MIIFFVLEEIKTLVATAASKQQCLLLSLSSTSRFMVVYSFLKIIIIIRKLFRETRTAEKGERKS